MTLRHQPIRMRTASDDVDGRLVLADDAPVAVLVRLARPTLPTFPDLDGALAGITRRLRAPH